MITKYGYSTVGIITIIAFILVVLSILFQNSFFKISLIILAIAVLVFTINFFRDPERKIPASDRAVVSPADGKVLFVKDVVEEKFLQRKAKQISIFMSPLDVHVNRIPISGKVEYLRYHRGEYLVAFDDKASERNERTEIGITGKEGKVLFTQVAGFIARRIVYDIKLGDDVSIGDRFGMIKFGSRVDVIVPEEWTAKVKANDRVSAGETILFEITQ